MIYFVYNKWMFYWLLLLLFIDYRGNGVKKYQCIARHVRLHDKNYCRYKI